MGRKDVCPQCKADIRCCLNCSLYERSRSKQCREPGAELIKEKSRANHCDFFIVADRTAPSGDSDATMDARKALNDLFSK